MAGKTLFASSQFLRCMNRNVSSIVLAPTKSLQHTPVPVNAHQNLSSSRALSSFSSIHHAHGTTDTTRLDIPKSVGPLLTLGNISKTAILTTNVNPVVIPSRGYQNVLRPRLKCDGCYFVWRHGRKHVECADSPSHKQMKKVAPWKMWKEDYSKGKYMQAMDWNKRFHREFDRNSSKTIIAHKWYEERIGKDI